MKNLLIVVGMMILIGIAGYTSYRLEMDQYQDLKEYKLIDDYKCWIKLTNDREYYSNRFIWYNYPSAKEVSSDMSNHLNKLKRRIDWQLEKDKEIK